MLHFVRQLILPLKPPGVTSGLSVCSPPSLAGVMGLEFMKKSPRKTERPVLCPEG